MSNTPFSNRQIEVQNLLNSVSKEGVSSSVMDEVMNIIDDAESKSAESVIQANKEDSIASIKMRLLDEPDWRKRAVLAASLISKSLE